MLFSEEALKASQFILLANQVDTPFVFIQNTTGYMVGKAYEQDALRETASALAQRIAHYAPLTVSAARLMVYRVVGSSWSEAFDVGDRLFEPVYLSRDAQEGPRAFREQREPRWEGR